ncbi:eukaryotic translation initiation factor 3A [Striga asiatica]|uniref:Eukaryotic translation initiation factor 3A n=1 Tax=Striga asiatica TaxID=4170 RepID=A0A5A7PKD8_STRAF|nr:eukaryotic translation initiation factor 3A [Striga asiatica]
MEKEEMMNVSSEAVADQRSTFPVDGVESRKDADAANGDDSGQSEPSVRRKDMLKALEAVERDSIAIAESYSSLFASLRSSLSEATSSTVDHMNCFSDAAGRLQECVLDASTKGNRYINSCLRLNEEMKGIDALATQLYPFFILSFCCLCA